INQKGGVHKLWPCTCLCFRSPSAGRVVGSGPAPPWHPQGLTYRCFLPDLTGFISLRRTGPGPRHYLPGANPEETEPRTGIQPRSSGLRVQGTATSPSSTAKVKMAERVGFEPTRRGFAPSTRFPGERLRPTQPSLRVDACWRSFLLGKGTAS